MLKNYGELIAKLIGNLREGSTDVSFLDCLKIMGNGILLMAIIVLMLAIIVGLFWFPVNGYGFFVGKTKDALNKLLIDDAADQNAINNMKKVFAAKKIVFFLVLFVIYIPVCIPAILYLLSLLIH